VYKEVLRSIDGVEIFPLISFAIFGVFFIGLLYWVFTADKNYINEMKKLPLE